MKKALSLVLTLLLVAALITACGKAGDTGNTATPGEFKTIGDIINTAGAEQLQSATVDGNYVFVYSLNGSYYRAVTALTEEQDEAIWSLDILADDYDAKLAELISPLVIDRIEDLSAFALTAEELEQWVGKTGEELFDAGWTDAGWNLDGMVFWMDYGPFQYDVVMEGEVGDWDSFEEEDIYSLTVKSVTPNGQLGDATNLD